MQYISLNHIIHIILSISKLFKRKTGEQIIHVQREREGDRGRETHKLSIYDHVWLCTYSFVKVCAQQQTITSQSKVKSLNHHAL